MKLKMLKASVSWSHRRRGLSAMVQFGTTTAGSWYVCEGTVLDCLLFTWRRLIRPRLRSGSWRNGNGCPPRVGGRGQG